MRFFKRDGKPATEPPSTLRQALAGNAPISLRTLGYSESSWSEPETTSGSERYVVQARARDGWIGICVTDKFDRALEEASSWGPTYKTVRIMKRSELVEYLELKEDDGKDS